MYPQPNHKPFRSQAIPKSQLRRAKVREYMAMALCWLWIFAGVVMFMDAFFDQF